MILSRTNINFGNVSYLQQKEESFTISTTTPITITNILSNNSDFVIVNQTFPVLISTSLILTVRFTANFLGLRTGILTISSNQPTVTLPVSASVVQPEIVVNINSLDFGLVTVGQSKTLDIIVSNYDLGDLHVLVNNFELSSPFSFSLNSFVVTSSSSVTLSVTFEPLNSGKKYDSIVFNTNDPDHPNIIINIKGESVLSDISVDKTLVEFGTISIFDFKQQTLKVTNTSSVDLIIFEITCSNPVFSVLQSTYTILPGKEQGIQILFSPESIEAFTGALTIISNSQSGDKIINLTGASVTAKIHVNKTSIDFGNSTISKTKTMNLLISNISTDDVDLILKNVSVTNNVFDKIISVFRAKKNSALEVPITFLPTNISQQTGQLIIESNDVLQPLVQVNLRGQGVVAPIIETSTNNINFGSVAIQQKLVKTFTIFNKGVSDLNITSINIISDSCFSVLPGSAIIGSNQSSQFEASFLPLDNTNHIAKIEILSNDLDKSTYYIDLKGEGVSSAIEISSLVEFGNVNVNTQKEIKFKIKNNSQVQLVVSNIVFSNSHFSTSQIFPLNVKSEENISLKFIPDIIGLQTDSVRIESNDYLNSVISFSVTGSGVTPQISIDPTKLDFLDVTVNQISILQVTIRNLGLSDLIINNVTIDDQVFSVDKTQFTIASNEKEVINVSFSPVSLGPKETEIRFNSDASTILLRAVGNGAFPIASISQNTLIFGAVVVNSSKILSISVLNSGKVDLNATLISSKSVYTLSEVSIVVKPYSSKVVDVEFKPITNSDYSAFLTISTNDPLNPTFVVNISGTGIVAPKIVVEPSSLDFGSTAMRNTKQLDLIIKNEGTMLLTYSIEIKQPVIPVFKISSSSGSVAIGSQNVLVSTFIPADVQTYSGKFIISSDDLITSQVSVDLKGRGLAAELKWKTVNPTEFIPDQLKDLAKSIEEVIPPILTALSIISDVLKIIKKFIIDFSDPIKILLEQLKEAFENFIKDLSASGVYFLEILPGPHGIDKKYFPNWNQSKSLFDPSTTDWFNSVKGGYSSFISKVVQSFDDPVDMNRPQFSSDAMAGGYILMFDAGVVTRETVAKFIKNLNKLMKMFGSNTFKVAYDPPTNITTNSSSNTVKVVFSPSFSLLPSEFFIFRSKVSGGYKANYKKSDGTYAEMADESGKPIRTWELVGITNVFKEMSKMMGISEKQFEDNYSSVGNSLKQLSKTFFNDQPFRFVFEDKNVENGESYFYVVAAGYTTYCYDDSGVNETKYQQIITQTRATSIFYLDEKNAIVEKKNGFFNSDIEKKFVSGAQVQNPVDYTVSKIYSLGVLSSEVSASPKALPEGIGGLNRCKNYRCNFDLSKTETIVLKLTARQSSNLKNIQLPLYVLSEKPINDESFSITVQRGKEKFIAVSSSYRIDYGSKSVFTKSPNYFKTDDELTFSYNYRKTQTLVNVTGGENQTLDSNGQVITNQKPIQGSSVKVIDPQTHLVLNIQIIDEKNGKIRVIDKITSSYVKIYYSFYPDFKDETFFKCVSPENTLYFFDIQKCETGQTLCPNYENANCYYNSGFVCTNISQKKDDQGNIIFFKQYYDSIYCQNGMMKQTCGGYSKVQFRDLQPAWPNWNAEKIDVLKLFPVINDTMNLLLGVVQTLLTGTSKMDTAIINFIDLLQLKIDSLNRFIQLIDSYIKIITEDFDIPDMYYLSIPFATGGNEYLKTSIQNSKEGPFDNPSGYTAGVVIAFNSPGVGNALKFLFGG